MPQFRVQLKEAVSHPDPNDSGTFNYILTNEDVRREIHNNRNFIAVRSSVTNLQYYIPVQNIAYVANICCLQSRATDSQTE